MSTAATTFLIFLTPTDSFPVSQFMPVDLITSFLSLETTNFNSSLFTVELQKASLLHSFPNDSLETIFNTVQEARFDFKIYQYDRDYPTLFIVTPEDGLEIFGDYIEKKASLMGFIQDDSNLFPYRPSDFEIKPETTVNTSNLLTLRGKTTDVSKLSSNELVNFLYNLPQDKMDEYLNLECIRAQSQASTPTRKLHYPEPFIASASFIHTDIAFIHILHYNYWLWFFFVFLIVFFFLTFLCTVRWCNMRTRPRRETRGVSRSKCGDLITACVPVSWAASIIISESTDASDVYDGFGAAEITVGIRAYQWGWEYYYPKAVDLNYTVKPSYSAFVGKSLKYIDSEEGTLTTNNLWKFYQNKETDLIVTPAHLLLLPLDQKKILNFFNFGNIGSDNLKESSAFKKITCASKTFNSNLVTPLTPFVGKYKRVNQLHSSENLFNLSNNYGLVRQHNLLSLKATTSQYNTFLDKNSFDKFLTSSNVKNVSEINDLSLFNNVNNLGQVTENSSYSSFVSTSLLNHFNQTGSTNFNLLKNYPTLTTSTSNFNYPLRKLFNSKFLVSNSLNLDLVKANSTSQNLTSLTSSIVNNTFNNLNTNQKFSVNHSSNNSVLPSDQSLRQYTGVSTTGKNLNLDESSNKSKMTSNLTNAYNTSRSGWINNDVFTKLATNRTFLSAPYSPIFSSNPLVSGLNYDTSNVVSAGVKSFNNTLISTYEIQKSDSINILKGKRDGAPAFLNTSYWKAFWLNSSPDLRYNSVLKTNLVSNLKYLPSFTGYYDYDFRNVQAYELLEDLFWETTNASYNHSDYLTIADNVNKPQTISLLNKTRKPFFFDSNTQIQSTDKVNPLTQPTLKDLSLTGNYYTNSIYFDDLTTPSTLLLTNDYSYVPLTTNLFANDESYESWNSFRNTFAQNSNYSLNIGTSFYKPQSYLNTINAFRANFEDFNWFNTTTSPLSSVEDLFIDNTSLLLNNDALNSSNEGGTRVSNPLSLRSSARNSIVTFNALQKVFRARFEDGRANVSLNQFSELKTHQPMLTSGRVPYENMLGKTRTSFYDTTFYNYNVLDVLNTLSGYTSSLNFNFFDFPFLLAGNSDMSRYMWFDWYARWGSQDVQLSSVSRFSSLGVPYISKPFDYNVDSSETITEVEKYFTRLTRTRKNYIPNWTYSPYMYARSTAWSNADLTRNLNLTDDSYTSLRILLREAQTYNTSLTFFNSVSSKFYSSNSGTNSYNKGVWKPFTSTQSYYYTLATLVDFLSKRESLYRHYLQLNNNVIHLPNGLTANPNNPLLLDLKASYLFNDLTSFSAEYSREFYYNSLQFFKYLLIKDWLVYLKDMPINATFLNDFLIYHLFGLKNSYKNGNAVELYKNPYKPLRKGISSMLRLHATGAIGMPIEVRLQILASSKDVIHSWSVPSAGVKIDCVPGYTSHKIMIFLMEGIYWGQCMEICGRYHHWMPIVVYFMRRDLFFLWCTHFIFNVTSDSGNLNDKQYTDFIRYTSYNRASWLYEAANNF